MFSMCLIKFVRVLLLAGFCVNLAVASDDPVVIRVGDLQQTRSEFEQRFGVVMLMTALSAGAPMKSGMQIRDLREHYMEQRVTELLLLQEASKRGLQISEVELDRGWTDFKGSLPEEYGGGAAMQVQTFRDEGLIRDYLREKLLLARFRQILHESRVTPPEGWGAGIDYISDLITDLRQKTIIFTCVECLE